MRHSSPGERTLSPLLRAWLHGRWAREARPDVAARLDLVLLVTGVLAAVALL